MRFISLGSGSSGNCYYIQSGDKAIIIDIGISIRRLKILSRQYGVNMGNVLGIFVTHDHTDHVKAVGALSQETALPVYTTESVHHGMEINRYMKKKVPREHTRTIETHTENHIGPFCITAFPVPHDSSGNNGYFIESDGTNLCLVTDAGHITPEMEPYIAKAQHLIIEANYDLAMLATGPYPAPLRRRIASDRGHMSNEDTGNAIARLALKEAKHIWLCHLSEENNNPNLALRTIKEILAAHESKSSHEPIAIEALPRRSPSGFYELI